MKKKINKKKVPACAFGISQGLDLASILGSGLQAGSGEESTGNIVGGTINSGASLASAGMMAGGPIGAAIGGGLGIVGGLISGITKRKALQKAKRVKANAQEIAIGKNNAATMEQLYGEDNPLAYTFENGGLLPDLAYLDNNEVIRDDQGNIDQVPNTTKGTDNHLVDASNLESVLSDKLKRPGTNRTFAQEGKKLTKMTKPSKGKDLFAEQTNELNKRNANAMYEQLLNEQEMVKAKKGIKPKTKGIPAYEDGWKKWLPINLESAWKNHLARKYMYTDTPKVVEKPEIVLNPNKRLIQTYGSAPAFYDFQQPVEDNSVEAITGAAIRVRPKEEGTPPLQTLSNTTPVPQVKSNVSVSKPKITVQTAPQPARRTFDTNLIDAPVMPNLPINPARPDLSSLNYDMQDQVVKNNKNSLKYPKAGRNSSSSLSGLAPVLYNFVQGMRSPEVEDQVLNPYTGAVNRAMGRRRMSIEPTLSANRRSRAINRNNMSRLNPNSGMNLAYGNQLATGEYTQNANTYATRDNANNAYLGEYANMMNNLGQQYVQNTVLTNDMNARNRAAARNFGATAAGQLGQWSQTKEQGRNQAQRDDMIYPFLRDFLAYGNSQDLINNMNKQYYGK